MDRVAIFVDAGYFWTQLTQVVYGSRKARTSVCVDYLKMRNSLLKIALVEFPRSELLRVYWYDGCLSSKTPQHVSIEELDYFKLRLGSINSLGHQKAVDGLIISDIISLAQSKSIADAIIVSGDADLVPGVVTAQNLGIRVIRIEMNPKESSSPILKAEVDKNILWNDTDIRSFASKAENVPVVEEKSEPEAKSTDRTTDEEASAQEASCISKSTEIVATETTVALFFNTLNKEEKEIIKNLSSRTPLPSAIDRNLLSFARKQNNNCDISKEMKITLRACIKNIALIG